MNANELAQVVERFPQLQEATPVQCPCGWKGRVKDLCVAYAWTKRVRDMICPTCGNIVGSVAPHSWQLFCNRARKKKNKGGAQ